MPPLVLAFLQALNANTNGGDASRVGKRCSFYLVEFVSPFSTPQDEAAEKCPDAGRVAPISGSVWCLSLFAFLRFTKQQ